MGATAAAVPHADPRPAIVATSRDLRIGLAAVGVPVAVFALLLFLYRADAPIWHDGATVINERLPPTFRDLVRPFHDHLNAVTIALWAVLPGIATKMAALVIAHVILAIGTAAFLISRLGLVPGVALALPLALLGSAHFNLLMPWQILFLIPLALGLVAIVASLPRERTWVRRGVVAVAIAVAAGASNVGLFLGFALGLWFLVDRRWPQILELVPAGLAWLAWFLVYGRRAMLNSGFQPSLDAIPYAAVGFANGVGGVAGVGLWGGVVLIVAGIAYAIWQRVHVPPAFLAFVVTVLVMLAVVSAFRSGGGRVEHIEHALAPRYVYLTGFFLAFGLGISAPRLPKARWLLGAGVLAAALNLWTLVGALWMYPQTCAEVIARDFPPHQQTGC